MTINESSPTILCTLFILLLPCISLSAQQISLSKGSSLSVENGDTLVSPDNSFICGFYKIPGDNAFAFSIWFASARTDGVVWTANRDRPVNGVNSKVTFGKDGTLVLTDVDGTAVWNTNTSSTDAEKVQLRNTGNLVITNSAEEILWQSFDSPTDTLLPTQPITKSKKLVSSMTRESLSSGYFSFFFDNNNVMTLLYDGPEVSSIYWPNPDYEVFQNGRTPYNSSRYGVLDEEGNFVASDRLTFDASDRGLGIRRRLTLDHDGNLRLYSLNPSNGNWSVSWEALRRSCLVHGICGRYGICVYTLEPRCACPAGYEISDQSDWSKGCRPLFNISCDKYDNHSIDFLELPKTDFWGFDLNYTNSLSLESCMDLCRNDCSCFGIGYKINKGECYTKSAALFNGRATPDFPGSFYLKLPKSMIQSSNLSVYRVYEPVCNGKASESKVDPASLYPTSSGRTKWYYFYMFISAFGLVEIVFIAIGWWFIGRDSTPTSVEEGYKMISSHFRKFTYNELKKATKNFKDELGRGGSGAVYKGVLEDSRVVAVKRLEDVSHAEDELWAEVGVIGRINHMNLVRMYGFCAEKSKNLLVFEYVDNLSLDKYLFSQQNSTNLLGWKQRFNIALGVAKGLAYLHHECLEWVIHCDVKPENILLDKKFEPKIADFGLAKLLNRGKDSKSFSRIRGTRGYMAPEWASNLPITAKVDVYSFGVVLLEIVRGIRVSDWRTSRTESEQDAAVLVRTLAEKLGSGDDSWIDEFVDWRLRSEFDVGQAKMMLEVACSCLEEDRSRRPNMESVSSMLLQVHKEELSATDVVGDKGRSKSALTDFRDVSLSFE